MPAHADVVAPPAPTDAPPTAATSAPTPAPAPLHSAVAPPLAAPFPRSTPQQPSADLGPDLASDDVAPTPGVAATAAVTRPRRIADLAAMAASVLRPRENLQPVHYIAEVDLEAVMVKRNKVGPNTNVYVKLESTFISILRNKSAAPRHRVNVRTSPVSVDVERRELRVLVPGPGKDRLIRLYMNTDAEADKWKRALDDAITSDITEFYTFGKTLGSGAYGDVVKAVHLRTKETRAVKIIKRGTNTKTHEHLDSEIQVMKRICHPNIVQTYQIFDLKKTIYIVMEYVPGGDLFDFVAQHESLSEAQGSQTIRSIFQAVEYLHRQSIVHRDLKPENILCANNSWPLQIKVSDFGFAHFVDPATETDNTMRTQVGTVYFMAPEIISNKGHGPAVDSWACGVILYTILTGRLPFPGKNTTEYFQNVLKGKPLFPAVLWKDVSEDAKSLVKGLLNVDPNKRLTSLGALQHRWIAKPDASYCNNEIRRDRSNLHSRRRRLFKARKAIIAVAMANKFKATIPQVVDKVGDSTKKVADHIEKGVKKTADGIEEGLKEIASGVKKVGDGIGEGTKKVAGEIGENTKKVAENIAEGTKKVAEGIGTGVKKTADGIETGLKKTADGIETGFKKTADGIETGLKKTGERIQKTADGIETGFKKTADGIETGFKKTADGIETGFKKTADGIETGFKKTVDGLENGVKKTADGVKKTGDHLKRGVEKVKLDRSRDTDGERSNTFASNSGSVRNESHRVIRLPFRRRFAGSTDHSRTESESRTSEIPQPVSPAPNGVHLDRPVEPNKTRDAGVTLPNGSLPPTMPPAPPAPPAKHASDASAKHDAARHVAGATIVATGIGRAVNVATANGMPDRASPPTSRDEPGAFDEPSSSTEYLSALEEQSETEDGWGHDVRLGTGPAPHPHIQGANGGVRATAMGMGGGPFGADRNRATNGGLAFGAGARDMVSKVSAASTGSNGTSGSNRPNLTPLSGLTLGLSDECMAGSSTRELAAVHGSGSDAAPPGAGPPNGMGLPMGMGDPMDNSMLESGLLDPGLAVGNTVDAGAGMTSRQTDLMRKATALLLASSPLVDAERSDVGVRP